MRNQSQRIVGRSLLLGIVVVFAGCRSTLSVTPYDGSTYQDDGVPFYLTRQQILVTELGLAEDGSVATDKPVRVELVTLADMERKYLLRNRPAWLSTSEFSITRDHDGRLSSTMAKADEKTLETVQSLASLAVAVAGIAIAGDDDLAGERAKLTGAKARLLRVLESESDPSKLKEVSAALAALQTRIDALDAKLAKPRRPGVKPSRHLSTHAPQPVSSYEEAEKMASGLPKNGVGIYLIPVGAGR